MLGHGGVWSGVRAGLPMPTVAPDLPGHGRAEWDGQGDFQAAAVRVAVAACDHGRCDIVGHSFGATVALRLAVEWPDLVRRLVLIEPVFFAAAPEPDRSRHRADHSPVTQALARGDRAAAARAFTGPWGTGVPWDALPEQQRAYITDRIHLVAASAPGIEADSGGVLPHLAEVTAPVLLMQGDRSPPIIDAIAGALTEQLADSRRVIILGAGHMLPITHPADVARAVRGFLG